MPRSASNRRAMLMFDEIAKYSPICSPHTSIRFRGAAQSIFLKGFSKGVRYYCSFLFEEKGTERVPTESRDEIETRTSIISVKILVIDYQMG